MQARTFWQLFIEICDCHVFRWMLRKFGKKIVYQCEWGNFDYIYSVDDLAMCRPIHENMTVAPPWANAKILNVE